MFPVPLSDDEQRILHEIERQFYEQDPAFARQVGSTTVYSHAGRNLKWAAVGFVTGLVLMITLFVSSLALGFIGFAVMFVSAVVFERNLRRMGKAGWHAVTMSPWKVPGGASAAGPLRLPLRWAAPATRRAYSPLVPAARRPRPAAAKASWASARATGVRSSALGAGARRRRPRNTWASGTP